nr:hypothetical protein [Micromonospora thermarum]
MPQRRRRAVAGAVQRDQVDTPLDGDAHRRQLFPEDPLGLRLRQEQQVGVRGVVQAEVEQRHATLPAAAVQAQPDRPVAEGHQVVGHAETGEDLQGPGLDRQGAGLVRPVEGTVDDARVDAEGGQLRGHGEPGGARPHHQHVVHARSWLAGHHRDDIARR